MEKEKITQEEEQQLFSDYIDNIMSPEQKINFEKELQQNKELADKFTNYKKVVESLKNLSIHKIPQDLDKNIKKHVKSKLYHSPDYTLFMLETLLGIIIIILIAVIFFSNFVQSKQIKPIIKTQKKAAYLILPTIKNNSQDLLFFKDFIVPFWLNRVKN